MLSKTWKNFDKSFEEANRKICDARASVEVLFRTPTANGGLVELPLTKPEFVQLLHGLFSTIALEFDPMREVCPDPSIMRLGSSGNAVSVDYANALAREAGGSIWAVVAGLTAEVLERWGGPDSLKDAVACHTACHAARIADAGAEAVLWYFGELENAAASALIPQPHRLRPDFNAVCEPCRQMPRNGSSALILESLRAIAMGFDPFAVGRIFRIVDGILVPAETPDIRPVGKFYGYTAARRKFADFFTSFASGKDNLPLLIAGLPGLGKTHITVSHALACPTLTLILAKPKDLEDSLEGLLRDLAGRPTRRFVLFFDDVDVRKVDWYHFRTHVGGTFSLPSNVAVVISSNHDFPANIASRGHSVTFPAFDETLCLEMVSDFLVSMGMRAPPENLVSVIAADYVEEFGQHVFDELSPRTLSRYLGSYEKNQRKRMRMLELSRSDVVAKPDSQIFTEANLLVVKRLQDAGASWTELNHGVAN